MADTRNQPEKGGSQKGGQGGEQERQRGGQGGVTDPERKAGQNPRRDQEEQTGTQPGNRPIEEGETGRQNK